MKKNSILRALAAFVCSLALFSGFIVQTQVLFADEAKEITPEITNFVVIEKDNFKDPNVIADPENIKDPNKECSIHSDMRLDIAWAVKESDLPLKQNDFFEIQLPNKFKFPVNHVSNQFKLYAEDGNAMANATVSPSENGGGTIKVTFTDWVKEKQNIKGSMRLSATFFEKNIVQGEVNTITISIGSYTKSFDVKIKKTTLNPLQNELFAKWAYAGTNNNGYASWQLRINHMKSHYTNVVITDELSFVDSSQSMDGIHYIPGSFTLTEVTMDEFGRVLPGQKPAVNISDKVELSENGTKFTYRLGNLEGKQYRLGYLSTFKDNVKMKNSATLNASEDTVNKSYIGVFALSSGQGQGDLISKIKILKKDQDDPTKLLKGAKFRITKQGAASDAAPVEEIVTNDQGEAISKKLQPGDYRIEEIEAPAGYQADSSSKSVTVEAGKETLIEFFNKAIPSAPIPQTADFKVTKIWTLPSGTAAPVDSVDMILVKDGTETDKIATLTKDQWMGEFKGIDISDPSTVYTVKEKGEDQHKIKFGERNFEVSYAGSKEYGFEITNKEIIAAPPADSSGSDKPDQNNKPGDNSDPGDNKPGKSNDSPDNKSGSTVSVVNDTPQENGQPEEKPENLKDNEVPFGEGALTPNRDKDDSGEMISNGKTPSGVPSGDRDLSQEPPTASKSLNKHLPKTGDGLNPTAYAGLSFFLGSIFLAIGINRKRKNAN